MFNFRKQSDRLHSREGRSRRLHCEALEERCMLAVVTVDTHLDTVDITDSYTSLREAIYATNLVGGPDTIEFHPSLSGQTILLTLGELAITDSLTINGLGHDLLTIDASGNDPTPEENIGDGSRVFDIRDGRSTMSDVEIRGLTLTGGDILGSSIRGGGAIYSRENLTLIECMIAGNSALGSGRGGGGGGGIYADGRVSIISSNISDNFTNGNGGGAYIRDDVSVIDSEISNNTAKFSGGGLYSVGGHLSVIDSVVSENSIEGSSREQSGGGIYSVAGSLHVVNSEILGNTVSGSEAYGGGIYANNYEEYGEENTRIINSTIADNHVAGYGGGRWWHLGELRNNPR